MVDSALDAVGRISDGVDVTSVVRNASADFHAVGHVESSGADETVEGFSAADGFEKAVVFAVRSTSGCSGDTSMLAVDVVGGSGAVSDVDVVSVARKTEFVPFVGISFSVTDGEKSTPVKASLETAPVVGEGAGGRGHVLIAEVGASRQGSSSADTGSVLRSVRAMRIGSIAGNSGVVDTAPNVVTFGQGVVSGLVECGASG